MHLATFLQWLSSSSNASVQWVLFQVICWVAFFVETGPWILEATDDALQALLPSANRRKRRYSQSLKEEVAKAAAEGSHGRSARQVLENMSRFQRRIVSAAAGKANSWIDLRLARYWAAALELSRGGGLHVFGLALDATRAGGKDMLFSCLYFPEVGKGFWLPPQDPL